MPWSSDSNNEEKRESLPSVEYSDKRVQFKHQRYYVPSIYI